MKTRDLIKQLQELDPEGNTEVVTPCGDIYFPEVQPAYWDGRLGVLIRDKRLQEEGYYHVKGMKIFSSGQKIVLHSMSLRDVIWDQDMNEMTIEYDSEETKEVMASYVNKCQKEYNDFINEIEYIKD